MELKKKINKWFSQPMIERRCKYCNEVIFLGVLHTCNKNNIVEFQKYKINK